MDEILGAGKHSETKELFFIVRWVGKPNSRDRVYDYQFKSERVDHMQPLRDFYKSHLVFEVKVPSDSVPDGKTQEEDEKNEK